MSFFRWYLIFCVVCFFSASDINAMWKRKGPSNESSRLLGPGSERSDYGSSNVVAQRQSRDKLISQAWGKFSKDRTNPEGLHNLIDFFAKHKLTDFSLFERVGFTKAQLQAKRRGRTPLERVKDSTLRGILQQKMKVFDSSQFDEVFEKSFLKERERREPVALLKYVEHYVINGFDFNHNFFKRNDFSLKEFLERGFPKELNALDYVRQAKDKKLLDFLKKKMYFKARDRFFEQRKKESKYALLDFVRILAENELMFEDKKLEALEFSCGELFAYGTAEKFPVDYAQQMKHRWLELLIQKQMNLSL